MAATCLQGSAVLPFRYSKKDDRKTYFLSFSGLFIGATNSAWRTRQAPLKSEVPPAFEPTYFYLSAPLHPVLIGTAIDLHGHMHQLRNPRQPRLVSIRRAVAMGDHADDAGDRKSTRLNSSH